MKNQLRVTDSTDELCFDDLARGDQVIRIPLFQREYVWGKKQFEKLADDIAQVDDESGGSQFLGAIVAIDQSTGPGRHRPYEVVDGQQRLTTLYLLITAVADIAAEKHHEDYAVDIINSYLLVRSFPGTPTNTRLVPCTKDRQRFADVWKALLRRHKKLKTLLRELPSPPPASDAYKHTAAGDSVSSKLYEQYLIAREYCEQRYDSHGGLEGLRSLTEIITTRLSFIFILLKDATSAPRIFENLNNAGVRTTVANLVRNEIFSRLSDDPDRAIKVFEQEWEPFQGKFGDRFDDFFFPYGLTIDPNVKKATLFEQLRKRWAQQKSPEEIIESLNEAGEHFLWVATDYFVPRGAPPEISRRLSRLRRLRAPQSTHSFLMQFVAAVLSGELSSDEACRTLDIIESFLVRRAICGFEPTGLHAVFKGLWKETKGSSIQVTKEIRGRSTVPWPDNGDFARAVEIGSLYTRNIAKYVLTEYELSLGADQPANDPEIEHVMPNTLGDHWKVTDKVHKKWVDTWANLVAVSPGLNRSLKNDAYETKRKRYLKESMFASPRKLASEFSEWNEVTLKARAEVLCGWALERWSY